MSAIVNSSRHNREVHSRYGDVVALASLAGVQSATPGVATSATFNARIAAQLPCTDLSDSPSTTENHPRLDDRELHIRYSGFEQSGSIRAYRFKRYPPKDMGGDLVVLADLSLFAEHHLAFQDGPRLCLELLIAESEDSPRARCERVLTTADVVAHIAAQPVHVNRPGSLRLARAATRSSVVRPVAHQTQSVAPKDLSSRRPLSY